MIKGEEAIRISMKTRTETIVTIDLAWKSDKSPSDIDVILPEDVSDWFVFEYDCVEILYIVKNGKIYRYDVSEESFKPCGYLATKTDYEIKSKCCRGI